MFFDAVFQGYILGFLIKGGEPCNNKEEIFKQILFYVKLYGSVSEVECFDAYIRKNYQVFRFVSYFIHLFLCLLHWEIR